MKSAKSATDSEFAMGEPDEQPISAPEQLSPGKVAKFPGSLVVNSLEDQRKQSAFPRDKRRIGSWVLYFTDGWDDVGIWKSAVGIVILIRNMD